MQWDPALVPPLSSHLIPDFLLLSGGWIMACFHIITAIIGAGVLGLPHALSMLGWLGGIISLVLFFAVTLVCSFMLSDMYEYDGVKHGTYGDAVVNVLGEGVGVSGMGVAFHRCSGVRAIWVDVSYSSLAMLHHPLA